MIAETRTYTIPLRDAYQEKPPHQKAPRAVNAVKSFLSKHMKAEKDSVKVSSSLNQVIWANGARNPPAKVTIVAEPTDSHIRAMTEDEYAEQPDEADLDEQEADDGEDDEQNAEGQDDGTFDESTDASSDDEDNDDKADDAEEL